MKPTSSDTPRTDAAKIHANSINTVKSPPSEFVVTLGSACPHCGGTSGYYYKNTIYGTQWMEWNGEPVSFDDHSSKHGIKRCMDCKKRITPNADLSGAK